MIKPQSFLFIYISPKKRNQPYDRLLKTIVYKIQTHLRFFYNYNHSKYLRVRLQYLGINKLLCQIKEFEFFYLSPGFYKMYGSIILNAIGVP